MTAVNSCYLATQPGLCVLLNTLGSCARSACLLTLDDNEAGSEVEPERQRPLLDGVLGVDRTAWESRADT